jgi:hypothetical protein
MDRHALDEKRVAASIPAGSRTVALQRGSVESVFEKEGKGKQ